MRRVSAKFVPRLLNDDQKENRVGISRELLASANGNENFFKNTITRRRLGFIGMKLKPRCNRRSGWGKGLLDQKTHDESVKGQGYVGCVFYWRSIALYEFVLRGEMVSK